MLHLIVTIYFSKFPGSLLKLRHQQRKGVQAFFLPSFPRTAYIEPSLSLVMTFLEVCEAPEVSAAALHPAAASHPFPPLLLLQYRHLSASHKSKVFDSHLSSHCCHPVFISHQDCFIYYPASDQGCTFPECQGFVRIGAKARSHAVQMGPVHVLMSPSPFYSAPVSL